MRVGPTVRLLLTFTIVFSLLAIPAFRDGPSLYSFPRLPRVHANIAPNERWYPAGPAMDTLTRLIYTDEVSEYSGLEQGQIDLTDSPVPDSSTYSRLASDPNFFLTNQSSEGNIFTLQFNMANNYWGCGFNFGNAQCGTDIRQAFAHAMDKSQFVLTELGGFVAEPFDNFVPPIEELNHPNPCGWDPLFPESGPGCIVNSPGGTAYHLATAASCNAPGGCGTNVPSFSYIPGLGTPDFCAAADHLIQAGLATGADAKIGTINGVPNLHLPGTGTCKLMGVSPAVAAGPIHFFARSDNNPRLHAEQGIAQFFCAPLTGTFSTGCPGAGLSLDLGVVTDFCGFTTSPTTVNTCWWIYTDGWTVFTRDDIYFDFNSRFVSGIPGIKQPTPGAFCDSAAVPSYLANNYGYMCSPAFDAQSGLAEFAPCVTATGDPATGQTVPTFANCPGTTQPSSASAFYKAEDIIGKNAYEIQWYTGRIPFAYRAGWSRMVFDAQAGFTPSSKSFLTTLDAWQASPPVPGTIRQGYKQSSGSTNPFIGATPWDKGIMDSVYDRPWRSVPSSPQALIDWMTVRTDQLSPATLGYSPPVGTVAAFRYTLRNDIFLHTGQKMTAWDFAFSYVAYAAAGLDLPPISGVKVLSQTQVDIDVSAVSFSSFGSTFHTQFELSFFGIIPGRSWSGTCSPLSWDAAVNNPDFRSANIALTPCIAPSSAVSPSGVIQPVNGFFQSSVDFRKIQPSYDNSTPTSMNLVGSGPWVCKNASGAVGGDCSSSHNAAPATGGTWTLQRFGSGTVPGNSLTDSYFRSSGNLALWAWSGNTGDSTRDFVNFSIAALCFGKTPVPTGCSQWSMGIGNPNGSSSLPAQIGLTQIGIIQRFYNMNWVSPYDWRTLPPDNIGTFPPVLYEGLVTLNPASVVGCSNSYNNGGGYDC